MTRPTGRAATAPTLTLPRKRGRECAGIWLEPIGWFPPGFLAEGRAERGQARIGGREPKRPSGLTFLVRIVNVIVSRVHLDGAAERVVPLPVDVTKPPQVHLPEVEARLAVDDPFRHRLAHPPGTCDPVGTEAGRDKEPANARLAEDELVVGREGLRSIDQLDHIAVLERGDALDGVLRKRFEARPVFGQQAIVEIAGDAVETPWGWIAFVATHHEPAG